MRDRSSRKGLVIGIFLLFIGAIVGPSISGNIINNSNIEKVSYFSDYTKRFGYRDKVDF